MIEFEKLEIEDYDIEYGAKLNNKPFSGIAFRIEDDIYSEYSYLNGDADGKWIEKIISTNTLIYEAYFKNGRSFKTHKQWNKDGFLFFESEYNEQSELLIQKKYYLNGQLKQLYIKDKSEKNYYEDGNLYIEKFYPSLDQYWFFNDGSLITKRTEYNFKIASYDKYEINYDWIIQNSHLLDRLKHKMILNFIFWDGLKKLNAKILETLFVFLNHNEPLFKQRAIYALGKYKIKEAIKFLEPMTLDNTIPNFSDFEDTFVGTKEFSIANTAINAIKNILEVN